MTDHIELTKTFGYSTKLLDELSTGAPLLGSTVHPDEDPPGEPPQLATERVVALDLMDNEPEPDPASGQIQFPDFVRITDPNGEFHDGTGTHRFHVQRPYWKAQSAFDLVHAYMEGRWDSARPYCGGASLMPPGAFLPRIFVAYRGYAAVCDGGGACASMNVHPTSFPDNFPFPELRQLPPGSSDDQDAEIIATLGLQGGGEKANKLLHELGHAMDIFLGPGFATVPQCPDPCTDTTCDEDTSDEAQALTETIAQLWTIVFIRHLYPIDYEDACPLIGYLFPTPTSDLRVHGPSCITSPAEVSLMVRSDSPDCPYAWPTNETACDKPSAAEDQKHYCVRTDGYRVASLMQAFWELANGRHCDPESPFECEALPVWPPDCESDPQTECATPLDLLIPAFAYAQRLRPATYRQFVDDFVRYVACNYGDVMYAEVNAVLCHHGATDCTAPPPTECAECGNEVREGGEECDGQDWIPNVSCEAFGFDGGQLACDQQACELDLSGCYYDSMASTGGSETGGLDETGTSLSGGGDDGGGDGCGCTAGPRGGPGFLVGLIALLGLRRRRARGTLGAIAIFVGAGACGDDLTTTSATTTGNSGSTEESSGEVASLPPEAWLGYYRHGWRYEGEPVSWPHAARWLDLEIRDDGTCLYSTMSCTSTEPIWTEVYECLFHDGFVRMRNFDGSPVTSQSHIYKDFHFGTECGVLHEYWVRDPDEYPYPEEPRTSAWYRGRLCVIETCPEDAFDNLDEQPILDEPWVYDLCPGEPTDCPCLETATACPEVEASP